jgi:serine/threonine protein kinase/tetratricopeptide (TPR) repeat protein
MSIKCSKCQFENPKTASFCAECGTRLISSERDDVTSTMEIPKEELTRGSTLAGRYEIIEELGKGGMGKVYRVEDTKLKQEVALKLIKPEIAKDKETIERFRNELKTARMIAHKNVCRMFDLGEAEGAHFITMEYVPGEDLKSMIQMRGQLGIGIAVSSAEQVCEGLSEAHRLGVVHRDLKPSNIMIDREGNVRIMDFGIARSLRSRGITEVGVMIGTPNYMSPEQVEGKEVDQRSDIYSLGIILYEMVTGKVPFEGDTPFTIGVKHKSEMPRNPQEFNSKIPDDLSLLIMRCLAKEKERRYQTAEELRRELERIGKGIPTTERIIPERMPLTSKEITVKFTVKKFFIPAASMVALVVIGLILWQAVFREGILSKAPAQNSVAVLPFIDLSPQKDHEWLSDGISDALITALSRLRGLRVPARTSSFFFKGKDPDIQEIGQKLKVENVLEGSVQVGGEVLRVNAQLTSVKEGYNLWTDKFDLKLADVLSIQDEIAREVVKALKVKLLGDEEIQLTKKYTDNLEAYNLYLQGRFFWNKRDRGNLNKSIEHFERALEKDPNYVLAYAGLADSYMVLGNNSFIPPAEAYPKAREFALKALAMDNRLAAAHATLALIKIDYDWDWAGAEEEFKLALQIDPGYGFAHAGYAFLLSYLARHGEAIKEIKTARDLDPLSPRTVANVSYVVYNSRKYDQALKELKEAIELYPEHAQNYIYAARIYAALGRYEEAHASLQRYREITGAESQTYLAYVYAKWGKREEAEKLLKEILERSERTYISLTYIAPIYGFLGDIDQAISLLEKAYLERDNRLCYLKIDPRYDPLRSDPRFKALLKKMNLDS